MRPPASPTIDVGGVSIPKLGVGTYSLHDDACRRVVSEALQMGYRHVDTAEMYQNEGAVGDGIRASGVPRDEVFLTTKVWHDHLMDGMLQAAAEASLERLGFDRVDLYLIHWPNADVPVAAAIKALNDVHHRGLARAIGVSNFPTRHLEEALAASDIPLAVNQVEYHPYLDQGPILALMERHDMALTAYCPLARGKVLDEPAVKDVAAHHGVSSAAVVLSWLVGQERVIAIPKSAKPERLEENLAALSLDLSAEERGAIDALARPDGRLIDPDFAPQWDRAAA